MSDPSHASMFRQFAPVTLLAFAAAGCGGGAASFALTAESTSSGGMAAGGDSGGAGELYEAAPENRLTDASQDSMATFSLDVDTASYTLMRRDVRAGHLPTAAGVRVEEYVNFFRYGDVPSTRTDGAPFGVKLESAPSPFGEGMQLLRVGVRALEVPAAPFVAPPAENPLIA